MKRYFKREAESELGAGTAYIEISDQWPSRQVEIYGQTWRWGDERHAEYLADQPFEVLELDEGHEITGEEFERAWTEALKRCPPRS
jgi:hypothetical protein